MKKTKKIKIGDLCTFKSTGRYFWFVDTKIEKPSIFDKVYLSSPLVTIVDRKSVV